MKIGITASALDLGPHSGHLQLLREAKLHCDHLILALQVDPTLERPHKSKPVQGVSERYLQAKACRYIDEVIPYSTEDELLELLLLLRPNIRFLGSDYANKSFTGDHLPIEIHFCQREHSISSSGIRAKIRLA